MLKGHVFKRQVFGNQIFALFINTFLNGENGISNNYKEGMKLSYSGSNITIASGAVIIQGRALEEDIGTTISAGEDNAFCSLVIEIDLDKENTNTDFAQGYYKIVKSTSGYPSLTKNNIVKNNAGVYQYELARFKTSANGIRDFQDKRTFLDLKSIFSKMEEDYTTVLDELEQKLAEVENGSGFVVNDVATYRFNESGISGTITKHGKIAVVNFTVFPSADELTTIYIDNQLLTPAAEYNQTFIEMIGTSRQDYYGPVHLQILSMVSGVELNFSKHSFDSGNSKIGISGTLAYVCQN